jgi:hypothetical protein
MQPVSREEDMHPTEALARFIFEISERDINHPYILGVCSRDLVHDE